MGCSLPSRCHLHNVLGDMPSFSITSLRGMSPSSCCGAPIICTTSFATILANCCMNSSIGHAFGRRSLPMCLTSCSVAQGERAKCACSQMLSTSARSAVTSVLVSSTTVWSNMATMSLTNASSMVFKVLMMNNLEVAVGGVGPPGHEKEEV